MLADKPKKFTDELEKLPKYWDKFKNNIAIPTTNAIYQGAKDLSRTRLIYDGCNAGIRVADGGLIRFYRNKYCNPSAPPEPTEPILEKKTAERPVDICGNRQLIISVQSDLFQYQDNINGRWFLIEDKFRINKIIYPLSNGQAYIEGVRRYKHNYSAEYAAFQGYQYPPENAEFIEIPFKGQTIGYSSTFYSTTDGSPTYGRAFFGIDNFDSAYQSNFAWGGYNIYQESETETGFYAYTLPDPSKPPGKTVQTPIRTLTGTLQTLQDPFLGTYYKYIATGLNVHRSNFKFYSTCGNWSAIPDPPPPPQLGCDCMQCCQDISNLENLVKILIKRVGTPQKVTIFDEDMERKGTQKADKTPQSLNDYLKLTTERIEITNRLLGIENYPMSVPDTMIEPFKDGIYGKMFKFIDGKKKRKINSITELIAWMSEQDSAVLGEFHQVIKFETEDKKESTIVLPNIAEALKEIVLLSAQMAKQNNVQTELLFKVAGEIVATKAAASKGVEIVQDIQDYLDYPTERKTRTIPSNFTLPKMMTDKNGKLLATAQTENYKKFLKPGEVKFVYEDWNGTNSFHDQMLDLLQLSAMLRAVYFQRTDK